MMDQSYPNLHVFAAVKGIPEGTYRRTVLPLFEHFIHEGRLTMRLFPNKNQLSNFLDTIRDLNVSDYDLFAKIDDDDLYGRDYFKSVNKFHLHLPPEFSSFYCGPGEYLSVRGGYPFSGNGFFGCFGPTLVLSRDVLEKLIICETNPHMISQISPRLRHAGYGFTEDNFMHMMMLDTGSKEPHPVCTGNGPANASGDSDRQCFRDARRAGSGRFPGQKLEHFYEPG